MTHHPRQFGFTIIELMLASALVVVLMVSLMGAMRQIAQDHAQNAGIGVELSQLSVLVVDTVRLDMLNADRVRSANGELAFEGHGGWDFDQLEISHDRVRVTYRIRRIGDKAYLVRTQENLNELTNRNMRTWLIADGIQQIDLRPLVLDTEQVAGAVEDDSEQKTLTNYVKDQSEKNEEGDAIITPDTFESWTDMPAASRLMITWNHNDSQTTEQLIVLR